MRSANTAKFRHETIAIALAIVGVVPLTILIFLFGDYLFAYLHFYFSVVAANRVVSFASYIARIFDAITPKTLFHRLFSHLFSKHSLYPSNIPRNKEWIGTIVGLLFGTGLSVAILILTQGAVHDLAGAILFLKHIVGLAQGLFVLSTAGLFAALFARANRIRDVRITETVPVLSVKDHLVQFVRKTRASYQNIAIFLGFLLGIALSATAIVDGGFTLSVLAVLKAILLTGVVTGMTISGLHYGGRAIDVIQRASWRAVLSTFLTPFLCCFKTGHALLSLITKQPLSEAQQEALSRENIALFLGILVGLVLSTALLATGAALPLLVTGLPIFIAIPLFMITVTGGTTGIFVRIGRFWDQFRPQRLPEKEKSAEDVSALSIRAILARHQADPQGTTKTVMTTTVPKEKITLEIPYEIASLEEPGKITQDKIQLNFTLWKPIPPVIPHHLRPPEPAAGNSTITEIRPPL